MVKLLIILGIHELNDPLLYNRQTGELLKSRSFNNRVQFLLNRDMH